MIQGESQTTTRYTNGSVLAGFPAEESCHVVAAAQGEGGGGGCRGDVGAQEQAGTKKSRKGQGGREGQDGIDRGGEGCGVAGVRGGGARSWRCREGKEGGGGYEKA